MGLVNVVKNLEAVKFVSRNKPLAASIGVHAATFGYGVLHGIQSYKGDQPSYDLMPYVVGAALLSTTVTGAISELKNPGGRGYKFGNIWKRKLPVALMGTAGLGAGIATGGIAYGAGRLTGALLAYVVEHA